MLMFLYEMFERPKCSKYRKYIKKFLLLQVFVNYQQNSERRIYFEDVQNTFIKLVTPT